MNPKGEMKGSAITGPVGKECADIWPKVLLYIIMMITLISLLYIIFRLLLLLVPLCKKEHILYPSLNSSTCLKANKILTNAMQ